MYGQSYQSFALLHVSIFLNGLAHVIFVGDLELSMIWMALSKGNVTGV